MFESICIRDQELAGKTGPLDMGFLAETLLFYQKVHVIGHVTVLRQLVPACGPDTLIELLQRGCLKVGYLEQLGAIQTKDFGKSNERHAPISMTSPVYELENAAPEAFKKATGKSGRGRRLASRFVSLVERIPAEPNLLDTARGDFLSEDYLENSFRELLRVLAPEYTMPPKLIASVAEHSGLFEIKTHIDFSAANASYHKMISPSHSSLTVAYFLNLLQRARENLHFASRLCAEMATSPTISPIMSLKVDSLVKSRQRNQERMSCFQDFILHDCRAIREAVNSGEKTFADVLKLLDKAEKFKKWLKDKQPEADLCKEYHHAVTRDTWVDKLPGKTARWSLFTGAGLGIDALGAGGFGTALGVGLGAFDEFILDRLAKGWKPNQFVEGPLNRFLNK